MSNGRGSYFVQYICQVLRERPSIELDDLRRKVAQLMSEHDKGLGGTAGMVPEVTNNTLVKRFRYREIQAKGVWDFEVDQLLQPDSSSDPWKQLPFWDSAKMMYLLL